MRTTLIIATLACYLIPCNAQEFSFKMFFEDAKGNKDTLTFGYDKNATDTVDAQFGEVEYFGTKMEKEFEVFIAPFWLQEYKPSYPILKKQIQKKEDFYDLAQYASAILVKGRNYPITISWDSTLFKDDLINYSVVTDFHPGGWFDASYGHEIGIFALKWFSKATFPYLGVEDRIINHQNETDTVRLVYFAFRSKDIVNTKQTSEEAISIFPNPAVNHFTVKLPSSISFERLQIYSIRGMLMKESFDLNMDISDIPSGIYVVKVNTQNGKKTFTSLLKKE